MAIKAEAIPDRQPTAGVSKEERVRASVPHRSPAQASTVSFRVGASVPAEQRAETSLPMVISVNGKTGKVRLTFSDVGALPASYKPPVTSVNGQTGDVIVGGAVASVNGKTGVVILDADDVGALPDSTAIPSKTSDLVNDSGFVNSSGAAAAAPVQSVNGQTGDVIVGGAVDSVNGQTGAVVLDAEDVGALPDTYVAPVASVNGKTGTVVLDADDIGALPDTYIAPVQSVNGKTGTVVLDADDVGALSDSTVIPSKTSDLTNDSNFVNAAGAAAAAPVQSVNGQTGTVTIDVSSGIAVQDDAPTGDELVWVDTDDDGAFRTIPEVDDDSVSSSDTWSSRKILNMIYPVGCYYYSSNPTSPATLFGIGTWEQITDRFLLAAGSTYTAGATGGEAEHTLTIAEMPGHGHTLTAMRNLAGSISVAPGSSRLWEGTTGTGNTGGGQAHNNMPPYLVAYIWHRTA